MKKVALFSCHHDFNYGSMLQAYALVAALRKLGYDSEYIDYHTELDPYTLKRIVRKILGYPIKFIMNIVYRSKTNGEFAFFHTKEFAKTVTAYERFHQQYIPVSSKSYYADTVHKKLDIGQYDTYMVGSDQTWSPHLYKPNKPYMLDFVDLPRRCSYASSLGTTDVPCGFLKLLKHKLSCFENLSCREATNSQLLTELLGREVTHVLDPTLLLTKEDWDLVAKTPYIKGDYILAYILGEKDPIIKFVENLGKEKNLPVYFVVTRPKYVNKPNALIGIGPDDWIGLIRGAKYVVTDSFHGCLFSINYNVNFYAFSKREGDLNEQDNARILEFLSIVGLKQRFVNDINMGPTLKDIDYHNVNEVITTLRAKSIDYLSHCIR